MNAEDELFYHAADILKKVKEKRGTVKSLIYASGFKNIRQLFALVNECMKNKKILAEVASECPAAFFSEPAVQEDSEVAVVLLYEHFLGRKFGRAVRFRKLFQQYRADMKLAVEKVLLRHGASSLKEACESCGQDRIPKIPRYMRVNLIKSATDAIIKDLQAEEWEFVGKFDQHDFKARALSLTQWQFGLDPVLPDLLVFPPGTDLHDHPLTTSGALVQQDRASCVPAHVLNPTPGSTVLDCCAAPGNKTSHLASLLEDDGRVIALDRDVKRLSTMTRLLATSGSACVELIHQDFLTVQPGSEDAEDIEFILVDPSCSGSGMMHNQADYGSSSNGSSEMDPGRIETLKRFQISILKHALRFPNAKRVVYSTCSVHKEENEEVAEEVMSQVKDWFKFAKVLPSWEGSRGLEQFPHADFFLRLSPAQDLTQGFFVACFERLEGETAPGEAQKERTGDESSIKHRVDSDRKAKKRKHKGEQNSHSSNKTSSEPSSDTDGQMKLSPSKLSKMPDKMDTPDTPQPKKKKKMRKDLSQESNQEKQESEQSQAGTEWKQEKKKKSKEASNDALVEDAAQENCARKEKKRKRKNDNTDGDSNGNHDFVEVELAADKTSRKGKLKKKKKRASDV